MRRLQRRFRRVIGLGGETFRELEDIVHRGSEAAFEALLEHTGTLLLVGAGVVRREVRVGVDQAPGAVSEIGVVVRVVAVAEVLALDFQTGHLGVREFGLDGEHIVHEGIQGGGAGTDSCELLGELPELYHICCRIGHRDLCLFQLFGGGAAVANGDRVFSLPECHVELVFAYDTKREDCDLRDILLVEGVLENQVRRDFVAENLHGRQGGNHIIQPGSGFTAAKELEVLRNVLGEIKGLAVLNDVVGIADNAVNLIVRADDRVRVRDTEGSAIRHRSQGRGLVGGEVEAALGDGFIKLAGRQGGADGIPSGFTGGERGGERGGVVLHNLFSFPWRGNIASSLCL